MSDKHQITREIHLVLENQIFDVEVVRKQKRHLSFKWRSEIVVVYAPIMMTNKQIENILIQNTDLLLKLKSKTNRKELFLKTHRLYQGVPYEIVENRDVKQLMIINNQLCVKDIHHIDKYYSKFLMKQAKTYFPLRVQQICEQIDIFSPYIGSQIIIKDIKSFWGKCFYSEQKLVFNCNLLKFDLRVVDAIIIHELAHFIHPNHSKAFYSLVCSICPDYKQLVKALKSTH